MSDETVFQIRTATDGTILACAMSNAMNEGHIVVEQAVFIAARDAIMSGPGAWYRGGKVVLKPQPPAPPEPERTFSWLEFMELFTEAEQVELAGAAMTDPTMKLWYDRALGAQGIYLSDERTIAGVNHAAEQGLITNTRRDAVLRGEAPNV